MKRAVIIVLDSVGAGALPDAAAYGDTGSNTLLNIKKQLPAMNLKNLNALGLSSITGCGGLADEKVLTPGGAFARLAEVSKGKDTTTGHWEIAGIHIDKALPTYPEGFPAALVRKFETLAGVKTIGNEVASGTEIISRLGDLHLETGCPILYTSADSVFQLAMHEEIIPIERQYQLCAIAREMLTGEHNVSRVIARPFVGKSGAFRRTENRRDFSLQPIAPTMLDAIKESGKAVAAVGKIEDIFAGQGITQAVHIKNNMDGVDKTLEYLDTVGEGLIFTNLVDFDMLYGHRNDAAGYAQALADFDARLPEILTGLKSDDILFITADHGCDPTTPSTDHSREYVPLIVFGANVRAGVDLGTRCSFADIGKTVLDYLGVRAAVHGESFLKDILKRHISYEFH